MSKPLEADEHVISNFFLVHGARRLGHGRAAVRTVTAQHPGRWAVAFQDRNAIAGRFWPAVVSEVDDSWSIERRPVSGRSDLPPVTWIRFGVRVR